MHHYSVHYNCLKFEIFQLSYLQIDVQLFVILDCNISIIGMYVISYH